MLEASRVRLLLSALLVLPKGSGVSDQAINDAFHGFWRSGAA